MRTDDLKLHNILALISNIICIRISIERKSGTKSSNAAKVSNKELSFSILYY